MLQILLTIAVLHWVVLVTPGANFLLVGQLAAGGRRSVACAAAVGITTVTLLWATLAVLGIGLVFAAHPALRQAAQIAGGAYLLHLAWCLWRASSAAAGDASQDVILGKAAAYRMGFLTNVLNPKTALFFGSVFATALPAEPGAGMIAAAVALVYVNALVWHLFLALAFSHPRVQAGYARGRRQLNRLSALAIGAFGAKLVVATVQEFRGRA